ncbi:MAG: hypothetical protein ISR47_02910 [Rhodospirillales bacterium]|nr:hypothetical protein [Rhodospirillales bacterium]
MGKKIIVLIAGILAVSLAFAFLGGMAIKIAALPLALIIFAVLAMMGWDFFDTMRASFRNGNNNGNDATET